MDQPALFISWWLNHPDDIPNSQSMEKYKIHVPKHNPFMLFNSGNIEEKKNIYLLAIKAKDVKW